MESELQKHYALLLGISSPWSVKTVDLKLGEQKVEIQLQWDAGSPAQCPECGRNCAIHDTAPERTWRHLDTMQFATLIRARTPRSECPEHGVRTTSVPWAAPKGRFTLLFERFALDVLLASASVSQACSLLRIHWATAQQIMQRGVERGLDRRQLEGLRHLGMDEKSFRSGQSYITLLTDLEESRVLDVVEDRGLEAAAGVWKGLSPEQCRGVEAVAVDMWEPFIRTALTCAPNADVVHDKFHVAKYLGEAVDKVRRAEHKELFSKFWEYQHEGWARRFFKDWFGWVSRSRLKPMVAVAHMLKRHLQHLLTYLKHRITNAVTEGLNSKIQSLKSAARGFRSFANYRIRILFFCGKLNLYPL